MTLGNFLFHSFVLAESLNALGYPVLRSQTSWLDLQEAVIIPDSWNFHTLTGSRLNCRCTIPICWSQKGLNRLSKHLVKYSEQHPPHDSVSTSRSCVTRTCFSRITSGLSVPTHSDLNEWISTLQFKMLIGHAFNWKYMMDPEGFNVTFIWELLSSNSLGALTCVNFFS